MSAPQPLTVDTFVADVAAGRRDEIQRMLDHDRNSEDILPKIRDKVDSKGDSAVCIAVTRGDIGMLKFLLEKCGCDPNGPTPPEKANDASSPRASTPLHLAVQKGDSAAVALLCQHGADPNIKANTGGWTPLHLGAFGKAAKTHAATLELLSRTKEETEKKCDFTLQTDGEGATALHFAAAQCGIPVVRCILELSDKQTLSALFSTRSNRGETVMHSALQFCMSQTMGGRLLPPEPQWEAAILLALAGCGLGEASHDEEAAFAAAAAAAAKKEEEATKGDIVRKKKLISKPATAFVTKKFPSMAVALNALAAAKIDIAQTLAKHPAGSAFYDFLSSSSPDEVKAALVGCSSESADAISRAMQQLEAERLESKPRKTAAQDGDEDERKNKQTTVLDTVVSTAAAAASTAEPSTDPDSKLHHGVDISSINIKTLKDGDDPSHGECPFLKIRADQVKKRNESSGSGSVSISGKSDESAEAAAATSNEFATRIAIAGVSFAAGWFACQYYLMRSSKK